MSDFDLGAWANQAACQGMPTSIFFSEHLSDTREAKAACAQCPVRNECRHHAITAPETHGIWGGETPYDRRGDSTRACKACRQDFDRRTSSPYCDPCRTTVVRNTAQRAKSRAKRREVGEPKHGTYSAYTNYACRCDLCRAAKRAYSQARRVNA